MNLILILSISDCCASSSSVTSSPKALLPSIIEKYLSAIKSSMDLVEQECDKATKEQRELTTINKGSK